ncbi:MAG: ABC transporter permease [Acetivibrionales bacterium]
MLSYVIKRVLLLIPIMLCVSFIVFWIMDMTPGDPAVIILGEGHTEEEYEAVREEYGLNDPFLVRYANYIKDILKGDFGRSWRTGRSVSEETSKRFVDTLKLTILSMILAIFIGIPLGVVSAVKQYSVVDSISSVTAMFLAAVPPFWLGMMLILAFALYLGWFPSYGLDTLKHYVLPVLTISLPKAAALLRFSRSAMLETIRMDYIRTARTKGAPESTVIFKHALRNALLPIITVLGVHFGHLLGGVVVIEQVFAIAGMGTYALTGIHNKDVPQVVGSVIILSAVFCIIMLIVDILYALVDPRTRSIFEKNKIRLPVFGRKK